MYPLLVPRLVTIIVSFLTKKEFIRCFYSTDIFLRDEDAPFSMRSNSSRFELRRKKTKSFGAYSSLLPTPPSASSPVAAPSLIKKTSSPIANPTAMSRSKLLRGKLRLHGELIDALHELASQPSVRLLENSGPKRREAVLEQALLEQNQILDIMQDLISTLESENKHCRDNIESQDSVIRDMSAVEARNKQQLIEFRKKVQTSHIVDSQVANLRRDIEDKDKIILSLQSSQKSTNGRLENSQLTSFRAKLGMERVRCIKLEAELSLRDDEIKQMKKDAASWDSTMVSKESEILYFRNEMETMRKFEQQQQDLIMQQKTSLADKDLQLGSLARAHSKERKVADQWRRIHLSGSESSLNPRDSNSLDADNSVLQTSLFEQISGRKTLTIELTKTSIESDLGFSIIKVDLPVSRQFPCLIVKSVVVGGLAEGLLKPGDELLEVNGHLCRSIRQATALRLLQSEVGLLKIVVARESVSSSSLISEMHHLPHSSSTPLKGMTGEDVTPMWATALSPKNTTFESFSVETMLPNSGQSNIPEHVTIPESYAISVTREMEEGNLNRDHGATYETSASSGSSISRSVTSTGESNSSLLSVHSKDEASLIKFHSSMEELQGQLDKSEHIRLSLESDLNVSRKEYDSLQEECERTKTENHEFQQQLALYETEVTDIRQYISELQNALVALQAQVLDEQEKLASVENQNKLITNELKEARDTVSQILEVRESLRQEVLEQKVEVEKKEDKLRELDEELERIKPENASLISSRDEMKELVKSLEKNIIVSEDTITSLKNEQKSLQSQLEAAKEILEKSSSSSEEEYQHLTSQLKAAKSLLADAEMKNTQSKVEMRYLKQAADLTDQKLVELDAEYQKTKEELGYFRQRAEANTLELEYISVNLKGALMKLEAKQEMVIRIQEEVDNLRRTNSKFRSENSQLKENIRKLDSQLRASSEEEKRLEEKLKISVSEQDEAFQQLEQSYEESSELSMNVERLNALVKELENEKRGQVETQEEDSIKATQEDVIKSLKLSGVKLQQALEGSQRKIEMLDQQCSENKSEVRRIKEMYKTTNRELQETRAEKEQLVNSREEINNHLVELQKNHSILILEVNKKDEELGDIKSTSMQYQEEAKIERQHSEKYKAKILELESDSVKAASEKEHHENMLASLEFMQKQQQGKMEALQLSVDSKDKEIKVLQELIDDLNTVLQRSKKEQTKLTTSNAAMKQKSKEDHRLHSEELKELKTQLETRNRELAHLSDDSNAHKTMAEMLQIKVKNLSESVDHLSEEKQSLERRIEENVKEKTKFQAQNRKLEDQESRLKLQIDQLNASTDSLSSESSRLRQQLRQNERLMDQANAELHAVEMNLEIKTRTLEEKENSISALSKKLENLETSYKDTLSELESTNHSYETSSMELSKKDEELSGLRTSLEMHQSQCDQLQHSVVTLQNCIDEHQSRAQEMEEERRKLVSNIAKFQSEKEDLEGIREREMEEYSLQIKGQEKDIEALQLKEKEHIDEIARLNDSHEEGQKTISQLLSAEKEMKMSLSKLGDEKDMEILTLSEKVINLGKREREATEKLIDMEQNHTSLKKELEEERTSISEMRAEIKTLKATESEVIELNERVEGLDIDLREKTEQLSELDSLQRSTESQLNGMKKENEALRKKALEDANLILTVTNHEKSIDELHRQLEEKETSYNNLSKERNQFLSRLREFEVHQYNAYNPSGEDPVNKDDDGPVVEDDKDHLDHLHHQLRQKEEEVVRTREYAENLLINVMMNAPHLLEQVK